MRQFAEAHEEFVAADVGIVRIFHSPLPALQMYAISGVAEKFAILADPERAVYREYGVGNSLLGVLNPKGFRRYFEAARAGMRPKLSDMIRDGVFGIVADFVIDPDGVVAGVRYGTSFSDATSPERALAWVAELRAEAERA